MNITDYMSVYNISEELEIPGKLPFEIFLPITNDIVTGIRDGYFISNYSRVYNTKTKKYLKCRFNNPDVYPSFTVMCDTYPSERKLHMHRIIMMVFCPVDNMENLFVNHKDGIKSHSFLWNLEWTTPQENAEHASLTGLYRSAYGENHVCATITEDQCREICSMLESRRYQNDEIATLMGVTRSVVEGIRAGKSWKYISKDYKLDYEKERVSNIFSYDQLCAICEYFQDNPKDENESLRKYLIHTLQSIGFENINESTTNSIRKLYKKERWKYVYCKYNY